MARRQSFDDAAAGVMKAQQAELQDVELKEVEKPKAPCHTCKTRDEACKSQDFNGDGTDGPAVPMPQGYKLRTRVKLPQGQLQGIFFYFHGLGDNVRRPADGRMAEWVNNSNLAYVGTDAPGHGLSDGKFVVMPRYTQVLDNYLEVIRFFCDRHANVPFFICAHSMSGGLSILLSKRIQSLKDARAEGKDAFVARYRGTVFLAPAILNNVAPPKPVIALAKVCCIPCCPTAQIPGLGVIPPETIWRDKDIAKECMNELLRLKGPVPLCTGLTLLDMTAEIQSSLHEVKYPFLVLHAEPDQVIPIKGSQLLFEKSATAKEDKHHVWYKELPHDLLNDPETERVLRDITAWIEPRMK